MFHPFSTSQNSAEDSVPLERGELTSESSWHAAGQIHTISSDPNISCLRGDTTKRLRRLPATRLGFIARALLPRVKQDLVRISKTGAVESPSHGLDQEFISVKETAERHPLIYPSHYLAAPWDPLDSDVDPSGVCYVYAKSARVHGAKYYTHTPVIETRQRKNGT
ncbi:FAD-dependent oxidoreductase [Mesorhizobium sp.]|uniref:FAD-dependent oxidoreductase n=1 Tax=Mesorhizobium sp. TaxID=1871066 RepID=UPI000FEA67E7|nr:MAG: FAD-binding oxidoreductase [Mesorhizobium sp.]